MEWRRVLAVNDNVATIAALVAAGLSRHVLANRLNSGKWQRVLPGVIVAHSGPISRAQQYRAAVLYGGPAAVLSHQSAGELLGLRIDDSTVTITIPHGRRKPSTQFVETHQSQRPLRATTRLGLPCTTVARTVIDIAAQMQRLNDVRAVVSDAVQRRMTTIDNIVAEAARAPKRGMALLNQVIEEVDRGTRSAPEAEFLTLLRRAGLPEPEFNADVQVFGRHYVVDALWRDVRVIIEIDGMAWHLDGSRWQSDLERQNALHAAGYIVLRFPPARLRADPDGVLAELRAVLRARGLAAA
jgi:very-short-patch-repair endonuclease